MPTISDYAEYADALRSRRHSAEEAAPGAAGVRAAAAGLLHALLDELGNAEAELRAQNDDLLQAQLAQDGREARWRALFELAPTAYLVTTLEACVLQANAAACALLRRPVNALVGQPMACLVALGERGAFRIGLDRAARSRLVEEWPMLMLPREAAKVDCRLRVSRLPDGERGEGLLGWLITETHPATCDLG